LCNQPGHIQRNCPDAQSQQQQHFQQRSH
jgi:hypothetical protein